MKIEGGGANIYIFVFTDYKNKCQSISQEINEEEHKYMNISPPLIIVLLAPVRARGIIIKIVTKNDMF